MGLILYIFQSKITIGKISCLNNVNAKEQCNNKFTLKSLDALLGWLNELNNVRQ
jgi:hypothetical protein